MAKTATGTASTWPGYWIGRALCRLGRHEVFQITRWEYEGRGDHVTRWCNRDCQWSDDFYTRERKPHSLRTDS